MASRRIKKLRKLGIPYCVEETRMVPVYRRDKGYPTNIWECPKCKQRKIGPVHGLVIISSRKKRNELGE